MAAVLDICVRVEQFSSPCLLICTVSQSFSILTSLRHPRPLPDGRAFRVLPRKGAASEGAEKDSSREGSFKNEWRWWQQVSLWISDVLWQFLFVPKTNTWVTLLTEGSSYREVHIFAVRSCMNRPREHTHIHTYRKRESKPGRQVWTLVHYFSFSSGSVARWELATVIW